MSHNLTYSPRKFLELNLLVAQWALDEEIQASLPCVVEKDGRTYLAFDFGRDMAALLAYDEQNDEFCLWMEEGDLGIIENAEILNPARRSTIKEMDVLVRFGQ